MCEAGDCISRVTESIAHLNSDNAAMTLSLRNFMMDNDSKPIIGIISDHGKIKDCPGGACELKISIRRIYVVWHSKST